jgi:cellulose synthase/poly-beta-1,6-N-acetylglucosamine synthase-like glycosyltransferase
MAVNKIIVSIGICVRDSERTIKEAVVSLVNQSFEKDRMEIVVIDDGCKDNTVPIIKSVVSKTTIPFRLLSTNGGGLTMARQMVIDNCLGYLVLFMDGDMVFPEDFVHKQVDFMERDPSVGAAQGTMVGKKSNFLVAELEDLSSSDLFESGVHRNLKRNPKYLGTGGSIFRVEAINAAGGFDRGMKGAAEDAALTTKIRHKGYSLAITDAVFEHEFKTNLKGLWRQYTWYGYGMHYVSHKHGSIKDSMLVYFWPLTFAWSIARAVLLFRKTKKKIAFFLPSYNTFRATAWWVGFANAHAKGYGH